MKTKKSNTECDFTEFESSRISKLSSINGGDEEDRRPRGSIDQTNQDD